MILLELFWRFLLIGMVAFGGGYAMLPVFEEVIVNQQGWLTPSLFIDMIAISQMTPGPIAINSATFIGFQTVQELGFLMGVAGALFATLGVVFVPVVLVGAVAVHSEGFQKSRVMRQVFKGLRPALLGLIGASVYSIGQSTLVDIQSVLVGLVLLALLFKFKLHPIVIILISAVIGLVFL